MILQDVLKNLKTLGVRHYCPVLYFFKEVTLVYVGCILMKPDNMRLFQSVILFLKLG